MPAVILAMPPGTKAAISLLKLSAVVVMAGAFVLQPTGNAAGAPEQANPLLVQDHAKRKAEPPGKKADPVVEKGFLDRVYKSTRGKETKFVLFVPHSYSNKSTKLYPVILYLHASSESGTDGKKQTTIGLAPAIKNNETNFPFFVIFPQSNKRSWEADSQDAQRALDILDAVADKYPIDSKRVYLTGIAMGGNGTWSLAINHPEKWAAIVPIGGQGDTSKAKTIKNLPCWCFHGSGDRTVPIEGSREMIAAMIKAGGKPVYTEYHGAGHSWDQAYRSPELYKWLLKQRKK